MNWQAALPGLKPRTCRLDIGRDSLRPDLCPEGGYRTQPRVSTLGTIKINEFALKGREADQINLAPVTTKKLDCAIDAGYNLEPTFALLVRSICRPFRARHSGWRFPGLKPWAESSCPFGAKTSRRDFLQMSQLTVPALKPWAAETSSHLVARIPRGDLLQMSKPQGPLGRKENQ
jgi:hypothetical protein